MRAGSLDGDSNADPGSAARRGSPDRASSMDMVDLVGRDAAPSGLLGDRERSLRGIEQLQGLDAGARTGGHAEAGAHPTHPREGVPLERRAQTLGAAPRGP